VVAAALSGSVACGQVYDRPGSGPSDSPSNGGASSGASNGDNAGGGNASKPSGPVFSGKGFVVHEWGTNTIVVGSDGSMQAGMHHEEEDLPAFVLDRMKEAKLDSSFVDKMETPVTYFYSDHPMTVNARVDFPQGIFSQWYPAARFAPMVAYTSNGVGDPALDPNVTLTSQSCIDKYSSLAGGQLDWGTVEVLAPDADVAANLEDAPLAQFTWSHARAVAANPIRTSSQTLGTQVEKFLFYRGLGNATMPATIKASDDPAGHDGGLVIANGASAAIASVFIMRVDAAHGAFSLHPGGIAPGASLSEVAPSTDGAPPLDDFADMLANAMTMELDRAGLFHDESVAMVSTWKRQWFKTPGVRVLYLAPQSWTDALIPLTIDPKPDATTRVMVIRTEVLTPAIEDLDAPHAAGFNGDAAAQKDAADYFVALGRFGEPRLRRALAKVGGSKAGDAYLWQNVVARGQAGAAIGE
jgi:hypothetical protein